MAGVEACLRELGHGFGIDAARRHEIERLADAIRFAQVAAALSVTRAGAQPSIPLLRDVEGFKAP